MKYLKRINEFNENEFEIEDEFRLGHDEQEGDENLYDDEDFCHDEQEGDENLYDDEDFYSTEDEEEGDEDFRFSNDEDSRNWGDKETKLERISSFNSFNEKMNPGFKAYLDKKKAEKAGKKGSKEDEKEDDKKGGKKAKPDFLDLDKDGDKKESMKKAAAEAKKAPAKKAPAKKAPAKKAPAKNNIKKYNESNESKMIIDSNIKKFLDKLTNHENSKVSGISKAILNAENKNFEFGSVNDGRESKIGRLVKNNIDREFPDGSIEMFVNAFAALNDGSSTIKIK